MLEKKEQWIRWEPIQELSKKYYIDAVIDDSNEFRIVLLDSNDENKKVNIIFVNSVDAYRSTDETFRLKKISMLDDLYDKNFYGNWTFFKVLNSDYLHWLSEESYTISDTIPFVHFALITDDLLMDIIASYEPTVELIKPV